MQNPFIPASTDSAMVLLYMIFGNVVNQMVSGGSITGTVTVASSMLAEAFRYFDSGVLTFGALMLTGVTIFGVANSANDGEVLGKTWNTFYTPIRSVSAAAALIPSSTGYASVQIMILYVVAWSVGFASALWSDVVKVGLATDLTQTALNSVIDDSNFNNTMVQAIRMGVCANGMNKAMKSLGQSTTLVWSVTSLNDSHLGTKTLGSKYFYSDPKVAGSGNLCGSITITDTQPVVTNHFFGGTPFSTTNNDTALTLRTALWSARNQFYVTTFQSWVPTEVAAITSAADNNTSLSATDLANNLATYKTQLTESIQSQVTANIANASSSLVSAMTSQGWIMAGSYWSDMAKFKDIIRTSSDSTISSADPDTVAWQSFFGTEDMFNSVNSVVTKYEVLADELTKQALANPASASTDATTVTPPTLQSNFTLNDFTGGGQGTREVFTHAFNFLPTMFVRLVVNAMGMSDDPVMAVKNVGDSITTFSNLVFFWKGQVKATLAGVSAAAQSSAIPGSSAVAGIVQGVLTWFTETLGFMMPSLYTLMYLGYWLGIWLPMVPFYVFAIGVVGWLVFVVEMMAAGMLWMAAHTTPARDNSFVGSQMQGYMLIVSGFFRPALMILGLVASNALLAPAVAFVNWAFLEKFESMTQDSLVMLTSVAGYLLGYTFIMTSVFMLIFGLPQTLPDRILRWIGAGIGDLGEQGTMGKVENASSSQSRAAMVKGMQFQGAQDSEKRDAAARLAREGAAGKQSEMEGQRHNDLLGAITAMSGRGEAMTETGAAPPIDRPE
jgi:conjugal transfer/type IV secretion protein DotA/TraY